MRVALWALLAVAGPAWGQGVTVSVVGRVAHAGVEQLAAGARLSDAVLKAGVLPDAYPLGAAWLRAALRPAQVRAKAGLLYEVALVRGQARLDGDAPLAALAARLEARWRELPATGRAVDTLLDPRPLEISTRNHLVGSGDRIVYPPRPTTVEVVGAVDARCTLKFVTMQAARRYRAKCKLAAAADPDWLYVIEPDGRVMRRGIALWNREGAQVLAPGAIVYVPIMPRALPASVRAAFNADAARFLSTQVLPLHAGTASARKPRSTSLRRQPQSMLMCATAKWIPACAGMTGEVWASRVEWIAARAGMTGEVRASRDTRKDGAP